MVKVGDMFYVQASDSAIQQGGECGGAVTATFKYLNGAKDMKLAVVGVGCDSLALQVQIGKGVLNPDNLVLIGLNCGGTLPPVKAMETVSYTHLRAHETVLDLVCRL